MVISKNDGTPKSSILDRDFTLPTIWGSLMTMETSIGMVIHEIYIYIYIYCDINGITYSYYIFITYACDSKITYSYISHHIQLHTSSVRLHTYYGGI